MTIANYFVTINAQINDNAEIFSTGRPMCRERDEDRTDLNKGVRNSQADGDKAIVGKARI